MDFDEFVDLVKILGLATLITVMLITVIAVPVVAIGAAVEYNYCQEMTSIMPDNEFRWGFWGGCRILLPDGTYASASQWLNSHRLELDVQE